MIKQLANGDKLVGQDVLIAKQLANTNGFTPRCLLFNDKFRVWTGTMVVRFTNGVLEYNATPLDLSQTPICVLLTPCSQRYSLRYDYDNSSKTSLRIEIINDGQVYAYTGNVRFSILIMEAIN